MNASLLFVPCFCLVLSGWIQQHFQAVFVFLLDLKSTEKRWRVEGDTWEICLSVCSKSSSYSVGPKALVFICPILPFRKSLKPSLSSCQTRSKVTQMWSLFSHQCQIDLSPPAHEEADDDDHVDELQPVLNVFRIKFMENTASLPVNFCHRPKLSWLHELCC